MYDLNLTLSHVPAQPDMRIREITIGALLREKAVAKRDAEALVEIRQDGTEGRRWTYAELLKDAERLALALSTRFAPGERLVVWSPNNPEWVLMEYACALSGLVLVTANPAFQARELTYILGYLGSTWNSRTARPPKSLIASSHCSYSSLFENVENQSS